MKSIGPYVVLREVVVGTERGAAPASAQSAAGEEQPEARPRSAASRTLWAADRLTGLPVLLHPLSVIAPAPRLPAHPRLLPFTDMVVEMAGAHLVTELPPQTRPARDPIQAARGALEVLSFLHDQGLAHGSLDAAQLWDVDGQVRVTGAGVPRPGLRPQPLDDLRDLVAALETLSAPPALLAALRGAPDLLSAREFLDLLDMGLSEQQLTGALPHVPALGEAQTPPPAIFDSPADIVLGGALADDLLGPAQTPVSTTSPEVVLKVTAAPEITLTPATTAAVEESGPEAPLPTLPPPPLTPVPASAPTSVPIPAPTSGPSSEAPAEVRPPGVTPEAGPRTMVFTAQPSPAKPAAPELPTPKLAAPELAEIQRLPVGEGVPPLSASPGPVPPETRPQGDMSATPAAPLEAAAIARPRAVRRAAGRQAHERLKADHRRRLDLSELRLRRTAAEVEQLHALPGTPGPLAPGLAAQVTPADGQGDGQGDGGQGDGGQTAQASPQASPQERRRLEQQAWEEQVSLDAELAAARRALTPHEPAVPVRGAVVLEGELAEIAEMQRRPRSLPLPARAQSVVQAARQLAPIRMGWGRDGERQVLRRRSPREELLRWLLPTLGALLLAFAFAALPRAVRGGGAPCCEVEFRLLGAGAGQQATLTLLSSPANSGWKAGTSLGQVPGTVRLPAPGSYRIKVSVAGYAPARVDVSVPRREPVSVQLGR